jgi:hypothetical protein
MQYAVARMQRGTATRPAAVVHQSSGVGDLGVDGAARTSVALVSAACTIAPSPGIPDATGADGADSEVLR